MKNIVVFDDDDLNSYYSKTFILTSNEEYRPPLLGLVADGKYLLIGSTSWTSNNCVVIRSDIISMDCPNKKMSEALDPSSLGKRYTDTFFDFSSKIESLGT